MSNNIRTLFDLRGMEQESTLIPIDGKSASSLASVPVAVTALMVLF
ncbi:hypothetical protein FACS1894101_2870 [Betaproteobacteria bacterium]|nr:hypothetical protein FACS1894101_2870 [Betaproteobacteria bacterium]